MRFRTVVRSIGEARKQIAGNSKMAATPMNYRSEIGQPIIINVILNISASTEKFHNELMDCFNHIILPSFREISQRYRGAIRIGCLLFSSRLIPAWYGYKTLDEIGSQPLKRDLFERKGLQSGTALYRAMQTGIFWTAAAMERMRDTGEGEVPKGKIIVISDGANDKPPKRELTVKKALDSIESLNYRNIQLAIVFLNTVNGLDNKEQFENICQQTGFAQTGSIEISSDVNRDQRILSFHNQIRNLLRTH
jgi:hypothetical protein